MNVQYCYSPGHPQTALPGFGFGQVQVLESESFPGSQQCSAGKECLGIVSIIDDPVGDLDRRAAQISECAFVEPSSQSAWEEQASCEVHVKRPEPGSFPEEGRLLVQPVQTFLVFTVGQIEFRQAMAQLELLESSLRVIRVTRIRQENPALQISIVGIIDVEFLEPVHDNKSRFRIDDTGSGKFFGQLCQEKLVPRVLFHQDGQIFYVRILGGIFETVPQHISCFGVCRDEFVRDDSRDVQLAVGGIPVSVHGRVYVSQDQPGIGDFIYANDGAHRSDAYPHFSPGPHEGLLWSETRSVQTTIPLLACSRVL